MFGAFLEPAVVCLLEGVEVALVVGIFLAYLIRTRRGAYVRCVFLAQAQRYWRAWASVLGCGWRG